jgi:hypothetical protein
MLALLDAITYDIDAATKATSPADRYHHCLRVEVAALQLAKLLDTKHEGASALYLIDFLNSAFSFCSEMADSQP